MYDAPIFLLIALKKRSPYCTSVVYYVILVLECSMILAWIGQDGLDLIALILDLVIVASVLLFPLCSMPFPHVCVIRKTDKNKEIMVVPSGAVLLVPKRSLILAWSGQSGVDLISLIIDLVVVTSLFLFPQCSMPSPHVCMLKKLRKTEEIMAFHFSIAFVSRKWEKQIKHTNHNFFSVYFHSGHSESFSVIKFPSKDLCCCNVHFKRIQDIGPCSAGHFSWRLLLCLHLFRV